jgi:hypothetical protein
MCLSIFKMHLGIRLRPRAIRGRQQKRVFPYINLLVVFPYINLLAVFVLSQEYRNTLQGVPE